MSLRIDRFVEEYRVFSNFSPVWLVWRGNSYSSLEHAYQAAKCANKSDEQRVRNAPRAAEAKWIGGSVQLVDDWYATRNDVMLQLLQQKFRMEPFKRILLSTDDAELVEGNYHHDNYWGSCMCGRCSGGTNYLGKLLMQVRAELTNEV